MTETHDRHPENPVLLAEAVRGWRQAQETTSPGLRDEADIAFEARLLEQGVINPADVIDDIRKSNRGVYVLLADGTNLHIGCTVGDVTCS